MPEPEGDPVLRRREQARRAAGLAQRGGWLLYGVAMVVFVGGFVADFTSLTVTVVVACLVVGSLLLAPGIVLGYAVRAADRDDRERGLG